MKQKTNTQKTSATGKQTKFQLSEDWLSVILAFLLMLMSATGIIGGKGIPIKF
jgi:hypothetical protein